ncbi:ThuA domain-containing protein [Fulvivirgaceae bacterium BMA10]|uniref:ThuA domain-containing protein n=1 Tax=Splendidivirga corallicola TaxID=3051826 RepID=A0ABT8KPL1_9BACT|nr:ThuA domain-containing protein [Fulvivirgaceae bacterium BMA10]
MNPVDPNSVKKSTTKTFPYSIIYLLTLGLLACSSNPGDSIYESEYIQILFLGHDSKHHDSEKYMPMLASALVKHGIHFTYTANPDDLNQENLAKYDGLAIYANHDEITPVQEKALLNYVRDGKGLIAIHCASHCFRNSKSYVDLVGGQFKEHGEGTFTARLTASGKEMIEDLTEFETWDETYVHHQLNPANIVLMERIEGEHKEPWTWINTQEKGRVFYTAYGHNELTWSNKGFHNLLLQGILWAVGDKATEKLTGVNFPEPIYTQAKIPNYEKREPPPKLQSALSAEESMRLTQIPPGFELSLFASEPDIINPIAMNWDERGRLWVIETVDYPNTVRKEDGIGDDRIKICEDTDNDGKADKFTIFAENLNIPTSMVFVNGGIIVSQAPHFLFLKDTDGDDRADHREVIMTGWGTFDTHAGPSNLKYGFDNKIWGTVGYSGYQGEVGGVPTSFRQGIFTFNPDGSNLQQVSKTSNNTWGLGFSEDFNVFASTANNTHSVFLGIDNRYLRDIKGLPDNGSKKIDGHYALHPITQEMRQVDVFGGFTAASGHNLYTARSFPENYWNKVALVCEPTGRLVHHAILEENGSGFKEKDGWNLIASNDNWFGPVHAEVGPDGAVWIADWYNFIIQHNPTPPGFENGDGNAHINPLRDRQHGRIYRLAYKGAKSYKPISLSKNDAESLVEALRNDNLFWRLTAQRLLVERKNIDVVPDLLNLIQDKSVDDIGINAGAIHALWALHGLGILTDQMQEDISAMIATALNHPSPGVRKTAAQVLPKTDKSVKTVIEAGILNDPNKNTQLTAILAVSELPASKEIGQLLYELSLKKEVATDEWLSQAIYIAAIKHKTGFIHAIQDSDAKLIEEIKQGLKTKPQDPWKFDLDISDWESVKIPGFWETTDIGDVDGTIWFRKEVTLSSSSQDQPAMLHLGPIDDSDETWVNEVRIGGHERQPGLFRKYKVPKGILKTGKNVIAIKVIDTGGYGGLSAKPEEVRLTIEKQTIALAGNWHYQIETLKGNSSKPIFNQQNTIAKVFLKNYYMDDSNADGSDYVADWPDNAKVIHIKTIVNEMKFDITSFNVEAGEAVEIRFLNNDFMQHNLLILSQGSLETVGVAADKLAADKDGAEKNYIPDLPEVLHATTLVDPDSEVVLRFIAPNKVGDYPFVCTFPGHWSVMNGIMRVTAGKAQ